MPIWLEKILPIVLLLVVVTVVLMRLPRVEVGHSPEFRRRRVMNWLPVGLTYAFLYMGRYNLTPFSNAVGMSNADYGTIDQWGSLIYGVSFLINGPLADRWGGKTTLLLAAGGSGLMNAVMGAFALRGWTADQTGIFSALYAGNMYFQSFGAVAIVKVNSSWFHVRERGTFGGIFGILISLGIYFAYDWGRMIAQSFPAQWVFFVPFVLLLAFAVLCTFMVKDTPGEAGHKDFDTADASSGDTGPRLSVFEVAKRMLTHPVILVIALIEFCSGFLRNAIMKWYPRFAKAIEIDEHFVAQNWGMLLCCAGILGGIVAGVISDRVFQSRRGPVAGVLYGVMLVGSGVMFLTLTTPALGWVVIVMSLAIIGVHGMLSGTASMDFGGKKNAGVAVGIIDGFVYLGTALQALVLKRMLPSGDAAANAGNWSLWPIAMMPFALIGLLLALRVWNAKPQAKAAAAH